MADSHDDQPPEEQEQPAEQPEAQLTGLPPAAEHELIAQNASDSGGATDGGREEDRPAAYRPGQDGGALSVVGIGASAGGVQVLQELFGGMAHDTGLAFVVVLHLDPGHESTLAQILQAKTKMPVVQVTQEVRVEPNHVYVIPPSKHLTMYDSTLRLIEPQQASGKRVAIDLFFRTLAEQYGQKCACIILSGGDSDGVIGLKHIKAQGGVTIAQDPGEAEFDSMPRSAIETGMVDWILPVGEMPSRLALFASNELAMTLPPEGDGDVTAQNLPDLAPRGPGGPLISKLSDDPTDETALHAVLAFLRTQTGHDFAHYKRATVLRRIARRLQVNALESVPSYLDFLHTHPGEARALLNDLLIGVTHFFRDQSAFRALEAHIPQLFAGKRTGEQLRVWVAGCATGEEAYSIAMLLCEHAERVPHPPQIQVFATDLDEEAIRTARDGIYPPTIEVDVTQERLRRFFFNHHGRYRVKKELRELVLFAEHDILRDSPFSRLDMVTCRNLLIYLKPEAQHRVLDIFHFALRSGGLLFLGGSETVHDSHALFSSIDKRNHIYIRRATPRVPMVNILAPPRLPRRAADPILPRLAVVPVEADVLSDGQGATRGSEQPQLHSLGELHLALLEQYAPPSVIVDGNNEILHMSPGAGTFLHLMGGQPSANILKLADESLRVELRTALFRAAQAGENVTVPRVRTRRKGAEHFINLHVRPAQTAGAGDERIYLVVFEEIAVSPAERAAEPSTQEHEEIMRHLEEELLQVRAQLNATVEQYETAGEELKASNEELQAVNEEMRSATEELETSREELQSINEELTTVNHELKSNLEELGRTNSDLNNLIASTDIATVFLDRRLRIKRFTPRASELFNVIASDIGRPLSDITRQLNYPQLADDARRVLADLVRVQREVQADGQWFLARLAAYRTVDEKIDGVALAFVEITERRRAEEKLRASEQRLQRMVNVPQVGVLTFDYDGRMLHVNDAFLAMIGYTRAEFEARPRTWRDFTPPEHLAASEATMESLRTAGRGGPYEREYFRRDGSRVWLMFVAADLGDGTIAEYAINIDDRKRAEEALTRSEEQFRRAIEDAPIPIIMHAEDGTVLQVSRTWTELTGYSLNDVPTFDAWLTRAYGEGADEVRAHMQELFKGTKRTIAVEFPVRTRDGDTRHWSFSASSPGTLRDGRRFIVGMAVDATEGTRAEGASRETEKRLRALVENLPGGAVFVVDRELRYQLVAGEALAIAGFREEDLIGRTIFEALPHELAASYEPKFRSALAGETFEHEHEAHGRAFLSRGVPLRGSDGEPDAVLAISYDITERKRVEQELREANERGRLALQAAEMSSWDYDVPSGEVIWNEQHFRAFGLEPDGEKKTPEYFLKFVHPEDRERVQEALRVAVEETGIYKAEFRITRYDNEEVRWMTGYGRAMTRSGDRVTSMTGVMMDVTERKQAEEALRQSEANLRMLADAVPQVIWTNNAAGEAVYFNKRWYEFTGLSYEESRGGGWEAVVHADDAAVSKERWQEALRNGEIFDVEYRLRGRDGKHRWFIGRNVPMKDATGNVIAWFGSATDIHDLKLAERARRESEERFRLLVEGAKDYAMFLLDRDNTITFWSVGAERVFGWSEQEAVGQKGNLIFTDDDELKGEVEKEINTALRDGRAPDRRWHCRKDKTRIWVDGVLMRLDGPDGSPRGFAKIARDASDQHAVEDALRHAKEELEQRVRERTRDLLATNNELERTMHQREQLEKELLEISEREKRRIGEDLHDVVCQELTATAFFLKSAAKKLTPESQSAATILEEAAQIVNQNVGVTRDLARGLQPADLTGSGLRGALQVLAAQTTESSGVTCLFKATRGVRVTDDTIALHLYRITQEAVKNAAKHARAKKILITLDQAEGKVCVSIEDDGKGFTPAKRSKGLGLHLMRYRANALGGELKIAKRARGGTEIRCVIPVKR